MHILSFLFIILYWVTICLVPHKPYGVHGLVRLFRFLCSIVNPKDINNTESMQFLGLGLINTIIEVRSKSLQNIPKLMSVIKDDLCRFLLQVWCYTHTHTHTISFFILFKHSFSLLCSHLFLSFLNWFRCYHFIYFSIFNRMNFILLSTNNKEKEKEKVRNMRTCTYIHTHTRERERNLYRSISFSFDFDFVFRFCKRKTCRF
jgi:hypothetical protein